MQEENDGDWLTTKYDYNALNEITSVVDSESNTTTIGYDMAGRRTAIDNPDTGLVEYQYDPMNHLTRKTTPNLRAQGKSISYQYYANQLTRVDYVDMPDVYFTYGKPGAAFNRAGRIEKIESGDVKEEFNYGALGEVTEEKKSILVGTNWNTYTTHYVYDNLGRTRSIVFPDGEGVSYLYDQGGNVAVAYGEWDGKLEKYIKKIEYNELGQRTKIEYGNNTTSTYTYDPVMKRLTNLKTVKDTAALPNLTLKSKTEDKGFTIPTIPSREGTVLQNITYNYDKAGNILERNNNGFMTTGTDAKSARQVYEYDDLNRLTDSRGTYKQGGAAINTYTSKLSYSNIGNIMSKVQNNSGTDTGGSMIPIPDTTYDYTYEYGSHRPHAVTKVGDRKSVV